MVEGSGTARGERASALWGAGARGGDARLRDAHRRSSRAVALLTFVALVLPLGAAAARVEKPAGKAAEDTHVASDLLAKAKDRPGEKIRVIIQSKEGVEGADRAFRGLGPATKAAKRLGLVGGVAAELPAALVEKLARVPGLIVTPDAPVKSSGLWSSQLWPHATGNSRLWKTDNARYQSTTPAIAIVDSGIDAGRADFGGRVVADVKINQGDAGDSRGHGTFVAGIAAGSGRGIAGAAPMAPIVSVDVMDDNGMAYVSDVIAGAQWIVENKDAHNIRVANFSLHTARAGSIRWDPLARAIEKLWLGGVVVVAAAGNYGTAGTPSGVISGPGNHPLVITVGAVDLGRTASTRDDSVAPWSAYGYTLDGFAKPDVGAAGRYMIGPVPDGSKLASERAGNMVAPGYIELSGTSFAAPVVAGAAAQLLARHPEWTPGQVKGALMLTARPVPMAPFGAAGVGQITVTKADRVNSPPDANAAFAPFVVPDLVSGGLALDLAAWSGAAWSGAAWSSAAWSSAAWSSAAWSSAAWASAAWSSAAWSSAAWSDAAWADAAWSSAAWADNAEGEAAAGGYSATDADEADIIADPDLDHPDADGTLPTEDPELVQEEAAVTTDTTVEDTTSETTTTETATTVTSGTAGTTTAP